MRERGRKGRKEKEGREEGKKEEEKKEKEKEKKKIPFIVVKKIIQKTNEEQTYPFLIVNTETLKHKVLT